MEIIENLLLDAGKLGLSMRQLKIKTGFSKRTINFFILNSKNINHIDPYIHGSFKKKIYVFVYKPSETTLINKFKVRKNLKKQIEEIETNEVIETNEIEIDQKFEKEWVLLN